MNKLCVFWILSDILRVEKMRKKSLSCYSGIPIFQSSRNNQTSFKQWPEIEELGQGKKMLVFSRERKISFGSKRFLLSKVRIIMRFKKRQVGYIKQ